MIQRFLFWLTVALAVYVYFGYPTMLWFLCKLKRGSAVVRTNSFEPSVSLIIAAYNEQQVIAQKLENSLALDYPKHKLGIVVVSDGSTDETGEIVRKHNGERVDLVDLPHNVGKASAQNQAVQQATGETLLFTDAEAFLQSDAARKLIRHFQDGNVGCAVGRVVYLNEGETAPSEGEGLYWRYELFLRRKESELGNLAMGSGSIMAVRGRLFEPLDGAVSEDFVLPMKAAIQGYRTVYEPAAIATLRLFQASPSDMFKTKVRTITLDTRSVLLCRGVLNPFRYPLHAWGLISHKLLRWLVPCFLIMLFAVNLFLLSHPFYRVALALQMTSYSAAGLGYLWQRAGRKPPRILGIPFSFCLVNAAALVGVARFLMGKKAGRWEPVRHPEVQGSG